MIKDLTVIVNEMLSTNELDDGQVAVFKAGTKHKIEQLCLNVEEKCGKMIEEKNKEVV